MLKHSVARGNSTKFYNKASLLAAIITSGLLYFVDWEKESAKAKELVAKADLAEALQVALEEDSFEPADTEGKAQSCILIFIIAFQNLNLKLPDS